MEITNCLHTYSKSLKDFTYEVFKYDALGVLFQKNIESLNLWMYVFEMNIFAKFNQLGLCPLGTYTFRGFDVCNLYSNKIEFESDLFVKYMTMVFFIENKLDPKFKENISLKKINTGHVEVKYSIDYGHLSSLDFVFNFYNSAYIFNLETINNELHIINNYSDTGLVFSSLINSQSDSKFVYITEKQLNSKFIQYKSYSIDILDLVNIPKEINLLKSVNLQLPLDPDLNLIPENVLLLP